MNAFPFGWCRALARAEEVIFTSSVTAEAVPASPEGKPYVVQGTGLAPRLWGQTLILHIPGSLQAVGTAWLTMTGTSLLLSSAYKRTVGFAAAGCGCSRALLRKLPTAAIPAVPTPGRPGAGIMSVVQINE